MSGVYASSESRLLHSIPEPSKQEANLLALLEGQHDVVQDQVFADLSVGLSPSFLAIARPDLAVEFAKATEPLLADISLPDTTEHQTSSYKRPFFDILAARAAEGDVRALTALPKFAMSVGQLATVCSLTISFEQSLTAQAGDRRFLQYLGTFDPQHIGHRIAVASALATDGPQSHGLVHVMADHPFKRTISRSYDDRYRESEERLYRSSLLDVMRVTQVDVPGALGFGTHGQTQMELLADVTGDERLRWLIGSDKLLLDAAKIRAGESPQKAIARLSNPRTHIYVVHRQSDSLHELTNAVDFMADQFGTDVTLVPELPYDCAPASSTRIKELRAAGEHAAADHMELYELQP